MPLRPGPDPKIPCLDLGRQHEALRGEIFEAFERVYARTAFSAGPFVEEFESAFAAYVEAPHAVGVANGTVALHLAMLALGIGEGDEVLVPANTFIATAWGVSHAGATPVFVDCDPHTWEIDPNALEAKLSARTRAVIGVHLYGQPFDFDAVAGICDRHGLALVEDAAQAQGARYRGRRVGGLGAIACFSFYPGKNLGACGEAGAITTRDESLAARLRSLRNHGSTVRYHHDEIGFNHRMGGLEGASLSVKLRHLDRWNARRRDVARRYREGMRNSRVRLQAEPDFAESVHHLFVVTVDDRDSFVKHLDDAGIIAAFHYPIPCHLQKAYAFLGHRPGDLPNAEAQARSCVSLPMFPELLDQEIDRVIDAVNAFPG
jgi:dTDP-4-amino-4,6-dideoxygalactose transaminase